MKRRKFMGGCLIGMAMAFIILAFGLSRGEGSQAIAVSLILLVGGSIFSIRMLWKSRFGTIPPMPTAAGAWVAFTGVSILVFTLGVYMNSKLPPFHVP